MTFEDYIEEMYPIKSKVEAIRKDPIREVLENDFLPYDDICVFEGELQKVVETSKGDIIPVLDLLSYSKEDVEKMNDPAFKEVWEGYMDCVNVEDFNIQNILNIASTYRQNKQKKAEMLA